MKKLFTFLLALVMSFTVIGGSLLAAWAAEPLPAPAPTPTVTVAPIDPGESDSPDMPSPKPDTI